MKNQIMKNQIICICGPTSSFHTTERLNMFRLVAECEGFVALTSTPIDEVAPIDLQKGVNVAYGELEYICCPTVTTALREELLRVLKQKILLSDVVFFLEYPPIYKAEKENLVAFAEENGKRIEFAENQKIGIKDFQEWGFRSFLNKLRSEGE